MKETSVPLHTVNGEKERMPLSGEGRAVLMCALGAEQETHQPRKITSLARTSVSQDHSPKDVFLKCDARKLTFPVMSS